METHKSLLNREVTLANIHDARVIRGKALEEYEKNELARGRQDLEACRLSLVPRLYDRELDRMMIESCENTCAWLETDDEYQRWISSKRRSAVFLWLSGIPGAGQYLPFSAKSLKDLLILVRQILSGC